MRKPVSAMPWHGEDVGVLVVCDDGTVWRWSQKTNTWTELAVLPDSPAIFARREDGGWTPTLDDGWSPR